MVTGLGLNALARMVLAPGVYGSGRPPGEWVTRQPLYGPICAVPWPGGVTLTNEEKAFVMHSAKAGELAAIRPYESPRAMWVTSAGLQLAVSTSFPRTASEVLPTAPLGAGAS